MLEATTDVLLRTARFLALAACLLGPLEALWPLRKRVQRKWLGDLAWLTLGALTLSLVVGPALGWLERARTPAPSEAARVSERGAVPSAEPESSLDPASWRIALAFLCAEVMAYLIHRAMHEVPTLWRFHRVHHEPEQLTWTTAWRQHPLDTALHAVAVAIPGLLLDVSLSSFVAVVLLRRLWTGLLHANVRFDFGPLEGVIATPKFHHLHHSTNPKYFNANYAGLLPVLDVLGGTRRQPRIGRATRLWHRE